MTDHATGYVFDKSYRAVPAPKSLSALAPGGAIASSARDMTQWLRMLTNSGRPFISPALFRELTTPLIAVKSDDFLRARMGRLRLERPARR